MNVVDPLFVSFHQKRAKLQEAIDLTVKTFQSLEMEVASESASMISRRLKSDSLKVLIVGQFKQGKSTLINALLGEEVLPAFAVPCTAVINEIKFGKDRMARVHFRSPLPDLPENLSPEARKHIEAHGPNVPPLNIAVDEIQKYVVIPDPAKDHGSSVSESPFSLVEIFWPIDLCRNGVEIIDSPGLNEHGTRTRVTTDYLAKVDAVVFVLSCLQLAGQKEMEFVEDNLRATGHEEIIFACNRFDQVGRRDRQQIIDYGRSRLEPLTNLGSDGVFFLSAADALDGRVKNDVALFEQSGMLEFEQQLAKFLVESRGRLKLLQPARQLLMEVNRTIAETIPSQLSMLNESTAELQRRHDSIQPQIRETQQRCKMVLERVEVGRERLRDEVQMRVENFIRDVADQVPEWGKKYQPTSEFKVLSLEGAAPQAKKLATEVAEHINEKVTKEYSKWSKDELTPLIQARVKSITEGVEETVDQIVFEIDAMKKVLRGNVDTDYKPPSGLERMLAGGAGFLIGDVGAAFVGANFGAQEMLKSLGPAVAIFITSLLIGITNPVILIGMLFTGGLVQALMKAKNIAEQLKMTTADKIASELSKNARTIAQKGGDAVHQQTEKLQQTLQASMNNELRNVDELIESVLSEKEAGDEQCRRRAAQLADASRTITKVQSDLNDLIFDHALPTT